MTSHTPKDNVSRIRDVIDITDNISPTLCLAKWYHTSIYMYSGQTHSCYHPTPHEISKEEIAQNPSALHNTRIKKKERAEMLVGDRPKGCQYCWNVENLGDGHISDRMIKTASLIKPERLHEIQNNSWDFDVVPEYIEIAFSNECNFKCGYCHPAVSSSFHQELKRYGAMDMVKNHALDASCADHTLTEDNNPYVAAWWKWWETIGDELNILRITGGEPLLHKSTYRLFDELRSNPKPNLEINVNSNMGIKTALVEKLCDNVNDLKSSGKIARFKLFTSVDTWGSKAEYIRTGLDLDLWEKNLDTYIRSTKSPVTFMCTFNILSVTSFVEFLKKILEWREKYQDIILPDDNTAKIRFDTPYLKEPLQYDMQILPKEEFLPHFDYILSFIEENLDDANPKKFSNLEYEKFRRVRNYFMTTSYDETKITEGRRDFYRWFTEIDRRRNTNFLEVFPDMENFWNMCKLIDAEYKG